MTWCDIPKLRQSNLEVWQFLQCCKQLVTSFFQVQFAKIGDGSGRISTTSIPHFPRENDPCCGALMCHGGPCGLRGLRGRLQAADLLPSQTMWMKCCSGSKEMEWMWPNWLVESTCAASANRTPFWKAWVIGVLRIACVASFWRISLLRSTERKVIQRTSPGSIAWLLRLN